MFQSPRDQEEVGRAQDLHRGSERAVERNNRARNRQPDSQFLFRHWPGEGLLLVARQSRPPRLESHATQLSSKDELPKWVKAADGKQLRKHRTEA
jgi:hypothetical protein